MAFRNFNKRRSRGFAPGRNSIFNLARKAARSMRKGAWHNFTVQNQALDFTADPTLLVLLGHSDFDDPDDATFYNTPALVHRVEYKFFMVPTIAITTFATVSTAWYWALQVTDEDEATDIQLTASANTLFQGGDRVLRWGYKPITYVELPAAQWGRPTFAHDDYTTEFSLNASFRKPVLVEPGKELRLVFQSFTDCTGVLGGANLNGVGRIYVTSPTAGR